MLSNYGAINLKSNFTKSKTCGVIDCNKNWEKIQKRINSETGECMDKCQDEFTYEYNTKCYKKCPKGTKFNEINNLCEDILREDEITINLNNLTTEISLVKEIITNENVENVESDIISKENVEKNNEKQINNEEEKNKFDKDIQESDNAYENIMNFFQKNDLEINNFTKNYLENLEKMKENSKTEDKKYLWIFTGICIAFGLMIIIYIIFYFSKKYIKSKKISRISINEVSTNNKNNFNVISYVNSPDDINHTSYIEISKNITSSK